jgi:type I restriction enzyme S subunit
VDFLDDREVGLRSIEDIVMRTRVPLPSHWSYVVARHEPFREFAECAMVGTSGRQRASAEAVARFPLAIADAKVAEQFDDLIAPGIALIRANDVESWRFAELRDTLLLCCCRGDCWPDPANMRVRSSALHGPADSRRV